jgi:hypothetical protein
MNTWILLRVRLIAGQSDSPRWEEAARQEKLGPGPDSRTLDTLMAHRSRVNPKPTPMQPVSNSPFSAPGPPKYQ